VKPTAFNLLSLQLGEEEEVLDRALEALETVLPGDTAFLPESVAWTASGSGRAFATLLSEAQKREASIVTTMNLSGDLVEDLPGAVPGERYNAVVIFTRHGVVHVPQAKLTPQSFEMDVALDGPGIAVSPYTRLNRLRLDWDDRVLSTRFFVCSDLWMLSRFPPVSLRCDVIVVLGNFAAGAERHASRVIGEALAAGVARTALFVNAFHVPGKPRRQPLAVRVEEVLDSTRRGKPAAEWPHPLKLKRAFHVYADASAGDFTAMARLPARKGRIAVARSVTSVAASLAEYPVTVVL
jgi:hypothetical protein